MSKITASALELIGGTPLLKADRYAQKAGATDATILTKDVYKRQVAVFGIGGVGGYVCEALVRSGVGEFDLIDDDKVCLTNLNRQIIATRKTIGKYKAEVMRDRILEINPDAKVNVHKCFFLLENADEFPFEEYDYIVDAVDTVTAKISLRCV